MTLTIVCTIDGGVKNSPLSCAPCFEKLGEEVLVDATEDVARRTAQRFGVEHAQHVFEDVVLESLVLFRQLARERRESGLDRLHRGC